MILEHGKQVYPYSSDKLPVDREDSAETECFNDLLTTYWGFNLIEIDK